MEKTKLSLKEVQEESLGVLIELKRVCEEHNWTFSLAYGTLIGAIRHHGFIPWDDDIDVWMPRKDYDELLDYYRNNAEKFGYYKIYHCTIDESYPFGIARFSDTRYELEYFGYDKLKIGLFVDIYPVDEINREDEKFLKKQRYMVHSVEMLSYRDNSLIKNIVKSVIKPFVLISNGVFSVNGILKKLDKNAQKYNGTNQKLCDVIAWGRILTEFPSNMLDDIVYVDFEGHNMPAVKEYDSILRTIYNDYMQLPPEEDRIAHHFYSAYRK